jgi:hypothetical protein
MSEDVLVIYHHIIAGAQESLDTTANTHFMLWSETNLTKCIVALADEVQAQRATIRELQARVETTTWYNGTLLTELSALRERAAELETEIQESVGKSYWICEDCGKACTPDDGCHCSEYPNAECPTEEMPC